MNCSAAAPGDTFCAASNLTNGAVYSFSVAATNRMGSSVAATMTYTVRITRAAASGGGSSGGTSADESRLPVRPPANVANGTVPGAVLVDGVVVTNVVLTPNLTGNGWDAVGLGFALSVQTRSPSGALEPLASSGAMTVPAGGEMIIHGDGYEPSSAVNVFAVPRDRAALAAPTAGRVMSRLALRAAAGAVYVGSVHANDSGAVAGTLRVPSGLDLGAYVLQINGVTPSDQVRSVNLLMDVVAGATSPRGGKVRASAFYEGGSARFSAAGQQKLQAIVDAIPVGAQQVQVSIVGVATSEATPEENIDLARDRAKRIASFLEDQGVAGEYTVSVSTTFTVEGKERTVVVDATVGEGSGSSMKAAGFDQPMTSSSGKPLTTATISYVAPGS